MSALKEPDAERAPRLLHEFFERSARRWPERIAVDVPPGTNRPERRTATYAELDARANAIARFLGNRVDKESVVAILLPRTSERLYAAQLGVLKAGGAYACIDPGFPDEQIRAILEDSDAVALLTDAAGAARLRTAGLAADRAHEVDEILARASELPPGETPGWLTPETLAYIIYTSGTTGRPKGVMIEHRSIVNLVGGDLREFGLTPADRVAQNSSAAYDSSIEESWLGFAAGATVVPIDDETVRLGPDLAPWLRREGITVFCPPPTLLRAMNCEAPDQALPDLALLYVGGEALPRDVADRWAPGRRLENGYGPTECTVTATRTTIHSGGPITIGRPVPGLHAWVLDESLAEVSEGQPGELCLGGVGLARGYRNRPELTAEKFPTHPLLGRIYRTGDLVERDADGNFVFHGRIDSQVKLRGYRIELEAIETRLVECAGVREAACRVQGEGARQTLVAFVVPEPGARLSLDDLKESLRATLPAYMVPSRIAPIAELPTTVGGKLNRRALPELEAPRQGARPGLVAPRNELERRLATAVAEVLRLPSGANELSIHDDFFNDLGGDSLSAALLVSRLREDPATAGADARHLYEARTLARLSEVLASASAEKTAPASPPRVRPRLSPGRTTFAQILFLTASLMLGSAAVYALAFDAVPALVHGLGQRLGLLPFLLLSPLLLAAGVAVYATASVLVVVAAKRLLIGRYRPLRAPIWGGFYLRNWMVQQTARLVPWTMLEGTEFHCIALRALGARIGRRVHIHRGVHLQAGGWDLLEIGDDVTIGQEAALRLVDLEDGEIVIGAITVGAGSTIDIRAGVGANTVLEPDSYLCPLSALPDGGVIPRGQRWDGIPARHAGEAPAQALPAPPATLTPMGCGLRLLLARFALAVLLALPYELPVFAILWLYGVDSDRAYAWLSAPTLAPSALLAAVLLATAPVPAVLVLMALASRALGRVRPGVVSRWSAAYLRVWLKADLLRAAGDWLSGTLFWPPWLRLAGMRIGRGCEISTIIDVVPELVEIGAETFFADGIYLGGPRVHRGTVTLAPTRLGSNTFLGNHAVIPCGQQLPDDILLGVCTVANDAVVRPGSSWFGHPPFELPRREIVECDRGLTHDPSTIRYVNRVFWELLRFSLPVVPVLVFSVWYKWLADAEPRFSAPAFLLGIVPLSGAATAAFLCLYVLALKWLLLGRVRPGTHPLWSCWCSRWDFLYVVWGVYASPALASLEGTLLLGWYLRAMGVEIGKRVVLGRGLTHVVDPDMLHFEDDSTVNCQFQAHTFEDRVLKIDHVRIGREATVSHNAVLLYGADIGDGARVAPHSVVMKRESLLPGRVYEGCPTRPM